MSDVASVTPAPAVTSKKPVTSRRAVTVRQAAAPAPLSFDEQILRAAGDKRIDVAKLRELMELRRQLRLEAAEEAFNEAMTACQIEMRPVEADAANDQTNSKYATLYALDRALRPIYSRHGFSLSFNTADCPLPNHVRVLCYVSRGLFTRTYQHDVAVTTAGPRGGAVMTPTHAEGSAVSYGKRYLELMIFHVTIGDPGRPIDDDGNSAGGFPGDDGPTTLTAAEQAHLRELMKKARCPEAAFLKFAKVGHLGEILAKNYDRSVSAINGYKGPAS